MNRRRNRRKTWSLFHAVLGLIGAVATSFCSAAIVPIDSVTTDNPPGSPPYNIQSITVGDYTVTVDQLGSGTSTTTLDPIGGLAVPVPDDLEIGLQYNAGETTNQYTVYMFGGKVWKNSNGDNPDFFIFEAGDGDNASLAAILPGGQIGQAITLPENWNADTGYTSSVNGQVIHGLALSITDLLDAAGNPLTNNSVIEGLAVTDRSGMDPSDWCAVMPPLTVAQNPIPADEAVDVLRDAALGWLPSESANTHNVYFGTVFDDVNNASVADPLGVLVSQGQDANSFDPEGLLAFGQTYYWRVDEVNGAPDFTVFQGNVWSFTAEPFSIPITGIMATASSSQPDMGPEKTIDGSGVDELDQHSTEATDMWLSGTGVEPAWIQYEFDRVYKLHELWVWNSNQLIESFLGLGAKDVTIEISVDGIDWASIENVPQFAQASGTAGYTHNTTVDLGAAIARFVRITINSGWGMLPQYGLSEVRFFFIPTYARQPRPASGDTDVAPNAVLSWRAGREAAGHEVVLSSDEAAVVDGTAVVDTVSESSFDLGALGLDLGATYYWRINEINEAVDPSTYAGDVWSFVTPDSIVVDDFEAYDDNCNRIFFIWQDGFGHNGSEDCNVQPSNGNGTGSIVGNASAPFAERTIVHGGNQSMPLEYDNASEAQRQWTAPQDWTVGGAQTLVLFFSGVPGNTGQLYVKISGTKVAYDGAADAIFTPFWTQWNIDLAATGANLQAVMTLAIGAEAGSGILYVDDILLYRVAPELVDQVFLEAEAADTLGASWRNYDDPASSGGKHIGSEDGDGNDNGAAPGPEWIATYSFDAAGGTYKVLLRAQEVGSDSFWVRITTASGQTHEHPEQAGTGWVRFNGLDAPDGWAWDEVHSNDHNNEVVNWTLDAGAHVLEIGKREDGVLLDAIVIQGI